MTSKTEIANIALQKIGDDGALLDVNVDNTEQARKIRRIYDTVRRNEIRRHRWNFAIKRIALAADVATPAFDFKYQYLLPADCLRPLRSKDDYDWQVEGKYILTDQGAPLQIRYLADIEDENQWDASFVEAMACRLAMEIAERSTGSTAKRQLAQQDYRDAINEARKADAFENPPDEMNTDDWLLARW